jgi:antirestriction protein ArdC
MGAGCFSPWTPTGSSESQKVIDAMPTTTTHEEITAKVIRSIEHGQTPPWRKPLADLENSGFPTGPASLTPFKGVDVLLLNLAATEKGLGSKFWASRQEWADLDSKVSGEATILADGTPVYSADQVVGGEAGRFRSRRRTSPAAVAYGPAEAVIAGSGATIHHRLGMEAAYHFPPADYIVFPLREQFIYGPGGLPGYYDSLFHELVHFSEPRLGWDGPADIRELRAEIAAPSLTARLGLPVLADMQMLRNHRNHLARWVKAMKEDPLLIFHVAADASEAVEYLVSLVRS